MVGADFAGAESQMRAAVELVEVEQQLLEGVVRRGTATEQGVLPAGVEPVVVKPGAESLGHRALGFIHAAHQLVIEPVLQRLGVSHRQLCVLVFGLEVMEHRRIIEVAEPTELVGAKLPMAVLGPGDLRRPRWLGNPKRRNGCGGPTLTRRKAQSRGSAGWLAASLIDSHGSPVAVERNNRRRGRQSQADVTRW